MFEKPNQMEVEASEQIESFYRMADAFLKNAEGRRWPLNDEEKEEFKRSAASEMQRFFEAYNKLGSLRTDIHERWESDLTARATLLSLDIEKSAEV